MSSSGNGDWFWEKWEAGAIHGLYRPPIFPKTREYGDGGQPGARTLNLASEVDSQRIALRPIAYSPFPNRTCTFQRIRLSRHLFLAAETASLEIALHSFPVSKALPLAFEYYEYSVAIYLAVLRRSPGYVKPSVRM